MSDAPPAPSSLPPPPPGVTSGQHRHDLESALATLLTAGTALAAIVLFLGSAAYLRSEPSKVLNFREFDRSAHSSVASVFRDAMSLEGAALMQLGVVLLILTPVARVFFTLVAFVFRRDWLYVVVTVIVLGVLLYGLFGSGLVH